MRGTGAHRHLDRNTAMLGELDGVADQVQQDLTKPRLIPAKAAPGRRINENTEVDRLLVGFRRQQANGGLDRVEKLEIHHFEVDLAGLELRNIENVVNQREQRLGAVTHCDRTFPLLRCQIGLQQQPVHPDDAVHRCTNLVRHIGEEIGFGAARPFGGFTRLLGLLARRGDLLLGGLAHGNVGKCPDRSASGQWYIVEFDKPPIRPPPLAHPWLFESAAPPDDLFQCLVMPKFLLSPLPGEDIVEMRLNRHQLRRQIHDFDGTAVAERNHAVRVDHHDALVHVFEGRFEKL